MTAFLIFVTAAAASWLATRLVLTVLERRAIFDHPNERSSHVRPTPRGGGLAVTSVALAAGALLVATGALDGAAWPALAAALALAGLSWLDDLMSLPAGLRLAVHAAAVAAVLATMPGDSLVFQGLLPPWLDRIAAGLLWIWFVNLFNFMDGIDGISGVETIAIGGGVFLLTALGGVVPAAQGWFGLAIAGAALGFLAWNWHPARIFMGDVGSVPLGFLLGWLLLQTAAAGDWAAAAILPLYYLADATITLARRALRGEKIWQAHREHFYQRPVLRGLRHDAVTLWIAATDLVLVALALFAAQKQDTAAQDALALGCAVIVVALLLWRLARTGAPAS